MEILEGFGFNPVLFLAQIINFLILLFVLKKFLFNPTLKVLKDREAKINKGLIDAEAASVLLEKTEEKKKEILKITQAEAEKILQEARTLGEQIRTRASEEAKIEAQNIISSAKEQSDLEFEKMKKNAKDLAINISQSVLHNVLQTLLSSQDKKKILDKALKELGKN